MEEDHDHEETLGARLIREARLNNYSTSAELVFPEPLTGEELAGLLRALAESMAEGCMKAGAGMIGHIKGRFVAESGVIRVHLVDPKLGAEVFGELRGPVSRGSLAFLAVVQGLEKEVLEMIGKEIVQRVLGSYR